jgi:hypothetical protein
VADKFEKLNKVNISLISKYDTQTFAELFFYSSPKIVLPIEDMKDFKSIKQEQGVNELLNEQRTYK